MQRLFVERGALAVVNCEICAIWPTQGSLSPFGVRHPKPGDPVLPPELQLAVFRLKGRGVGATRESTAEGGDRVEHKFQKSLLNTNCATSLSGGEVVVVRPNKSHWIYKDVDHYQTPPLVGRGGALQASCGDDICFELFLRSHCSLHLPAAVDADSAGTVSNPVRGLGPGLRLEIQLDKLALAFVRPSQPLHAQCSNVELF